MFRKEENIKCQLLDLHDSFRVLRRKEQFVRTGGDDKWMDAIRKREGICRMLGGEMPDVMQMRGSKEPKASDGTKYVV